MSRAEAVRDQLATLGVPVDRMTIIVRSFGECRPVASNATATGRAQNRRVEIREFGDVAPGPADAAGPAGGRGVRGAAGRPAPPRRRPGRRGESGSHEG